MEYLPVILTAVLLPVGFIALYFGLKAALRKQAAENKESGAPLFNELREQRRELSESITRMSVLITEAQRDNAQLQDKRLAELTEQLGQRLNGVQKNLADLTAQMDERLKGSAMQSEQKLENIRTTVENRLSSIQQDNNKKLDEMRATVDEKLQKTLEERLGQSFQLVSERLEQVQKGLGEMQNLAVGVGDLKKVLSNVKTRGTLGEIQLGAILEEILSPEQYAAQFSLKRNGEKVDYAVKLPGDGTNVVYLPIDSKYPSDAYMRLIDAYEDGDRVAMEAAKANFVSTVQSFARSIHEKYISPPTTTDFAIMFLPVEGMYAEAIRCGLVETLQNKYKINISGPTTMAALLNSLQMGFKTLAIQKRSGEVWQVLSAVKTEFKRFGDVLDSAKKRLEQTSDDLDKLVGVRTRAIQGKLRQISELPEVEAAVLLESGDEPAAEEEN